VNFKVERKQH